MKIAYLLLSVFVYTTVEGATCQSDSECDDLNNCINSVCIHKSLMPLAPSEWGASVCLLILAVIATAGGVHNPCFCVCWNDYNSFVKIS